MLSWTSECETVNDCDATPARRLEAAAWLHANGVPDWQADCEVDLHCHSFYSDGYHSPAGRVFEAWRRGMKGVAVVDHDLFDGVPEALEAGKIFGIRVVAGAEFYTDRTGIEILAFFPDSKFFLRQYQQGVFADTVETIRNAKQKQLHAMLKRVPAALHSCGITGAVEPADIARYVRNGITTKGDISVILWEKYGTLLAERNICRDVKELHSCLTCNPAQIQLPLELKLDISPVAFVRRIRSWGGLPVLAHPVELRNKEHLDNAGWETVIEELGAAGLQGIEVDGFRNKTCPESGRHQTDLLEHMRLAYNRRHPERPPLVATNGGDTHNQPNEIGLELGCGLNHNLRPVFGTMAEITALEQRFAEL